MGKKEDRRNKIIVTLVAIMFILTLFVVAVTAMVD